MPISTIKELFFPKLKVQKSPPPILPNVMYSRRLDRARHHPETISDEKNARQDMDVPCKNTTDCIPITFCV